MKRCFDLALMGRGRVSPNPMVGAVLVYRGKIIGEGYHREFGKAHAEVNALADVAEADRHLISRSTLYVSLEPCCFHGKTPPCTGLLLGRRIPRVIIYCLDDTPEVAGRGVAQLRAGGVEVVMGVLEEQGRYLSRPRRVFVLENRPYIILKFAQSLDGRFAPAADRQFWISNAFSRRLVHKWRSEIDAIMVGTRTALIDRPQLTNRLYFGKSPLRIVVDRRGIISGDSPLFDGRAPTMIVTERAPAGAVKGVEYLEIDFNDRPLSAILETLHRKGIGVLMIEGGRLLLESFLRAGLWDEVRLFIGGKTMGSGIDAPQVAGNPVASYALEDDRLIVFENTEGKHKGVR